jgi:hypothetical protein
VVTIEMASTTAKITFVGSLVHHRIAKRDADPGR